MEGYELASVASWQQRAVFRTLEMKQAVNLPIGMLWCSSEAGLQATTQPQWCSALRVCCLSSEVVGETSL